MSNLPLKKRFVANNSGEDDNPALSTVHPEQNVFSELKKPESDDATASHSSRPFLSLSHMGSFVNDELQIPHTQSSTFTVQEIPKELQISIPEDTFSMLDKQPSTSTNSENPKKRKKPTFIYMINGHPVNSTAKKTRLTSLRSDESCISSSSNQFNLFKPPTTSDIPPFSLPTSPIIKPGIDFFPSPYRKQNSCLLPRSLLHHSPFLQMTAATPYVPFPGVGEVLPAIPPPTDPEMSSQNSIELSKKKKAQRCRFCANHDLYELVKGHKFTCKFRMCQCRGCNITRDRQVAVRKQAKETRHQESVRSQQLQLDNQDYLPLGHHSAQLDEPSSESPQCSKYSSVPSLCTLSSGYVTQDQSQSPPSQGGHLYYENEKDNDADDEA